MNNKYRIFEQYDLFYPQYHERLLWWYIWVPFYEGTIDYRDVTPTQICFHTLDEAKKYIVASEIKIHEIE
jgi:hypothetical protein